MSRNRASRTGTGQGSEEHHRLARLAAVTAMFDKCDLLGLEVGHNEALIRNLHALGLEAFVLAIAGVLGSVIAARLLWVYLYRRKGAKR